MPHAQESGPCGYGIHRLLRGLGHDGAVVAPALIPSRPGDRIKTDRRDCLGLAKLDRAGELTAVWVPDAAHQALRDRVRARAAAVGALRRARQQLTGFSARATSACEEVKNWTLAHRRWLATLMPGGGTAVRGTLENPTRGHALPTSSLDRGRPATNPGSCGINPRIGDRSTVVTMVSPPVMRALPRAA